MPRRPAATRIALAASFAACLGAAAAAAAAPPQSAASTAAPACGQAGTACTPDKLVAGLERHDGLLGVYLDRKGGRVIVALPPAGKDGSLGEFLYQVYISDGLGSTPVALDRSEAAPTQLLAFRRAGKRVFAELENTAFRADQGSPDERAAVRESFATSVIWSGDILAEAADGTVYVDLSSFLTRDAFGVVQRLRATGQGEFKPDAALSYADLAAAQVFPENLEFEAVETFSSDKPGPEVRGIAPDAHLVTLAEHQSLIKLPPPGYVPRLADPRTGAIASVVADYSTGLSQPVVYRLAHRFRLEKTDPTKARSTVKKPIVFYVDRAAPEGVRKALVEGARWWAAAFDAAGFIDAFRVEVLPEGVSPLDARYNVINWVHRQTRGWSYGENIIDPRTGEIVKGAVLLGSLRVRQDRMIFEGLAGAARTGSGAADDPIEVAYARLRQLAVHETGHAIGLEHNFAGSTFDDRASVMDYPPPRVGIRDGRLDFSDAYKVGVGSWDRFAIHWLYDEAAPGTDQQAELDAIVRDGYAHGLRFVNDGDARPVGSSNPAGSLWDDGPDAVAGLEHALAVRRIALGHFGVDSLPPGAPLAELRRVIVPVYLFHRYELAAVAKSIGGADFTYAVKGDGLAPSTPVPGAAQRRALDAILRSLDPAVLDLPDPLLNLLSAGQPDTRDVPFDREVFGPGPAFDLGAAAAADADIAFTDLLDASRLNRVAAQSAGDATQLGLPELLSRTVEATFFGTGPASPHRAALRRAIAARLVVHLGQAMRQPGLSPAAAADIRAALTALGHRLDGLKSKDPEDAAMARYYAGILLGPEPNRLQDLLERDGKDHPAPPPGMPIGAASDDGWFSEAVF